MKVVNVIGIDCSATRGKTGLARAVYNGGELSLRDVRRDNDGRAVSEIVLAWLSATVPNVIADDAPLGWPNAFGSALKAHSAGGPLPGKADELFKRHTDRVIQDRLLIQPLSVGADRIARTAHAALGMLQCVAERFGSVPLAWEPRRLGEIQVIEVYPSATRRAWGDAAAIRRERGLAGGRPDLSDHERDACACLLAAHDFLTGQAVAPKSHELHLAVKEGWIWVAKPRANAEAISGG